MSEGRKAPSAHTVAEEPQPFDMAAFLLEEVPRLATNTVGEDHYNMLKIQALNAYWELSQHPAFKLVLQEWAVDVLLTPCVTDVDRGRQEFLRTVLQKVKNAVAWKQGKMRVEVQR